MSILNENTQTVTSVCCSIILSAGDDVVKFNSYLLSLKLPTEYEFVVLNDHALPIDEKQFQAHLPMLKIINIRGPLEQEQLFESGAVMATGDYLLFVSGLLNFDGVSLLNSIKALEASGEKMSVSADNQFVLIEKLYYASIGISEGLFGSVSQEEPVAPKQLEAKEKEQQTDQEWEHGYSLVREPKVASWIVDDVHKRNELELKRHHFDVIDYKLDVEDYWRYMTKAFGAYEGHFDLTGQCNFHEKSLEHYLAAKLLELKANDVYIDIASGGSAVPRVYKQLYGCKTYKQDITFPDGLKGDTIGGDAASIPIPDNSVTKMGLHCSFEHFENDSDIRFIKEAKRILCPGGRVCIVPLYLYCDYVIQTDPAMLDDHGENFESDAIVYCWKGSRVRHSRFYDIPHLISRVRDNLDGMDMKIYSVRNARDLHPSCYVRFMAVLEKK